MTTRTKLAALIAVAGIAMAVYAGGGSGELGIPSELAGYRSWPKVFDGPRLQPEALATQCLPMSAGRLEKASKQYGPHTDRWTLTYANPTALAALRSKKTASFPAGSILVKEKLVELDDATPDGVAFMTKKANGSWEFRYFPAPKAGASYDGCIDCHRAGGTKDSVFATAAPAR